jgi:glucose/arabinose dehydrogenase
MRRSLSLLLAVPVLLAACEADRSSAAGVRLVRVGSFDHPLYVTAPPGDPNRLYVVEQTGRIRVVRNNRRLGTPFLDLRGQVSCCDERGLLSMAFAPDYATSGRFYVDYTDRRGNTRVVELRRSANPDRAARSSRRLVLFQRQPEPNHNGGLVLFGPDDLLYVGLGDGGGAFDRHGSRGNGQNLGTLLGKILRIDPRPSGGGAYGIPSDNPFVHRRGARPEIYAYGLRNPWRFSFDRTTGDVAIADVGQNAVEEVDFARRGGALGVNYGWRVWEGRRRDDLRQSAPGAVFPVLTYGHRGGACSITGGYVVRDPGLPALAGQYVYGDYCAGRLHAVHLRPGASSGDHTLGLRVPALTSFGEDARGRVYVTSQDGPVYRLATR